MIKVNLLKNKAIVAGAPAAEVGASSDGKTNTGLAENIGKAGFANLTFGKKSTTLDSGFDTFECSPVAQFLKLILLVGFIVPLVAYEKMRSNSSKAIISEKNRELRSYQTIKFEKDKELSEFKGLPAQREEMEVREQELGEIKTNRITALHGIDELQTLVPGDVWLTSINYVSQDRLNVEGRTLLDSGLDRFLSALKSSKRLARVNTQQDIKTKSRDDRTINEFKLTMSVIEGGPTNNEIEGL